jgi:hypothetical protein
MLAGAVGEHIKPLAPVAGVQEAGVLEGVIFQLQLKSQEQQTQEEAVVELLFKRGKPVGLADQALWL